MDTLDISDKLNHSVGVNEETRSYMLEIAKWSRFLSILGFIAIGLMILAGIFMAFLGSAIGGMAGGIGGGLFAVIYLVIAALYFFPIYYLFLASRGIKQGLLNDDEVQFTLGFANLKSHYKFLGILTIIILAFYVLALLFALVFR